VILGWFWAVLSGFWAILVLFGWFWELFEWFRVFFEWFRVFFEWFWVSLHAKKKKKKKKKKASKSLKKAPQKASKKASKKLKKPQKRTLGRRSWGGFCRRFPGPVPGADSAPGSAAVQLWGNERFWGVFWWENGCFWCENGVFEVFLIVFDGKMGVFEVFLMRKRVFWGVFDRKMDVLWWFWSENGCITMHSNNNKKLCQNARDELVSPAVPLPQPPEPLPHHQPPKHSHSHPATATLHQSHCIKLQLWCYRHSKCSEWAPGPSCPTATATQATATPPATQTQPHSHPATRTWHLRQQYGLFCGRHQGLRTSDEKGLMLTHSRLPQITPPFRNSRGVMSCKRGGVVAIRVTVVRRWWYRWKEESGAVRMVVVGDCESVYWPSCDRWKKWSKKRNKMWQRQVRVGRNGWQWQYGWQRIDDSGTVGKRISGRFDWSWLEIVKVYIDRVVIDEKMVDKKMIKSWQRQMWVGRNGW
jgi:hypothetical protein